MSKHPFDQEAIKAATEIFFDETVGFNSSVERALQSAWDSMIARDKIQILTELNKDGTTSRWADVPLYNRIQAMRSPIEIATDLSKARELLRCHGYTNAAGRTQEELASIKSASMKLHQEVWQLEKERNDWIEQK